MDYLAHNGDTLLLEDNRQLMVISKIEYNNKPYLVLTSSPSVLISDKATENEIKSIPEYYSQAILYFAEEVVDTDKKTYSIAIVEDKKLINGLIDELKKTQFKVDI